MDREKLSERSYRKYEGSSHFERLVPMYETSELPGDHSVKQAYSFTGNFGKIWSACKQRKFNTQNGKCISLHINISTILPAYSFMYYIH
jgi:hypothetical protein